MNKHLMIALSALFAMSKLDFETPSSIEKLRLGFCASSAYCALAYFWIYKAVMEEKDETLIETTPATDEKPAVKITKFEHDQIQLKNAASEFTSWVLMMGFMHVMMGALRPVFLMSIINPFHAVDSNLFRIYILGEDDESGEMVRPWPTENMLNALFFPAPKQTVPPPAATSAPVEEKKTQ